jgi:large subunit ribosomal protein L30
MQQQEKRQPASGKQIRITLVRSVLGCSEKQRRVVRALGLGKSQRSVLQYDSPIIRGMINKVPHLLSVEVA